MFCLDLGLEFIPCMDGFLVPALSLALQLLSRLVLPETAALPSPQPPSRDAGMSQRDPWFQEPSQGANPHPIPASACPCFIYARTFLSTSHIFSSFELPWTVLL